LVLSRSRLRLVAAIVPPLQNFFTPPALTIFWPSASTNPREHWVHRLQMTGPSQSGGIAATVTLGHLYVSDFLNDAVEGFSINSSTGALSAVSGSPFPLGGTPPDAGGLTMFVSGGSYLYATNPNAGTVAGFTFDSSNGRLTPVPGSPFPAGNTPVASGAGRAAEQVFIYNRSKRFGWWNFGFYDRSESRDAFPDSWLSIPYRHSRIFSRPRRRW